MCLPRPSSYVRHEIIPLLYLAGFRLEVEILPPQARRAEDESADAIKVLYGGVFVDKEDSPREALSVPWYCTASTGIAYRTYQDSEHGAVLIRLIRDFTNETSWPHVTDIPLQSLLKVTPSDGPQPDWRFRQVEKGKDFWNLKGFEIRFTDQTPLAHLQFWAAGIYTMNPDHVAKLRLK